MQAIEERPYKRNLFILQTLVTKDFKLKYRRSILGVLWSILNPLLTMIVLAAVFSFMFRFEVENFPLYLILGHIMFALMANATSGAMNSIIDAAPLIKKIKVEKLLFPVEKVSFELLNFVISLVAAAAVMIYFQVLPTWSIIFLPLLLVYVVLFSAGLGLLLAALAVFFRDTIHLWGVVLTAWTYATPLFYPVTALSDWMQAIMQFNPMYQYITYFRDITMWQITPTLGHNLICLGMALVTFFIGFAVFRRSENKFILHV
jgi:ABC-2 type transport system permease protein